MWSVRMRASRKGLHISGAEGLFEEGEINRVLKEYAERARIHPRGPSDSITVTVERLGGKPREIAALPLMTLDCSSPREARMHAGALLRLLGVSSDSAQSAFRVLRSGTAMRGAALLHARSGRRLEPDRKRGVRASRLGIKRKALVSLSMRLGHLGLDTTTVKEALALASKVASTEGIMAELCISDDPHYTTGYLASRRFGYTRLPNVKEKGAPHGGRVFFLEEGADVKRIIRYLQERPVIVAGLSEIRGVVTLEEFKRA
jgi:6-carboxyhexanoate--CoA ligase